MRFVRALNVTFALARLIGFCDERAEWIDDSSFIRVTGSLNYKH